MASIFKNEAAWVTSAKARPLEVGPGPQPNPSENEVVIKVAYAAVNPTDWKVSDISSEESLSATYKRTSRCRTLHTLSWTIHSYSAQTLQELWYNLAPPSLDSRLVRES